MNYLDSNNRAPKPKIRLDRNKFLEVSSHLMPHLLHQWAAASKVFGQSFDQNQKSRPGVRRGYVLPEPALFVNHAEDTVGQGYMAMYLKLRQLLMYRVGSMGMAAMLSGPEWRKVLGLEVHTSKAGSRASETRKKLIAEMQQSLSGSSLVCFLSVSCLLLLIFLQESLDLSKLKAVTPTWNGQEFPGRITDHVFQEVLTEIFTVSFKQEFLFLDHHLYELQEEGFDMEVDIENGEVAGFSDLDASSREERLVKVTTSILGFMDGEELGLASSDLRVRQQTLYGMHRVMLGWTRMPRMALRSVDIIEEIAPGSQSATYDKVQEAEYHLAYFYVSTFADFFKRAPVLPCVVR